MRESEIDHAHDAQWRTQIYPEPKASSTNWTKLQTTQNTALFIDTGCHLMVHQNLLHEEGINGVALTQ